MNAIGFPLALALHASGVALALVLRRRPAACRWAALRQVAAVLGLGLAAALGFISARAPRRSPPWGCGGDLSAETECTATAFAKPLVMVFRGIYRRTREVSTVEKARYFASEVRYRSEIGAPFERHVYGPATRAVLAAAERLRVIQAGSLHAYLAYVLVLGVILLWWLGGMP
jgi:hydrogenase-4 component B